ncbi:hypothetical protein C2U69_18985 [Cupriavidus pinatubonensis]|nr:hypothetical protein C2U69_18985 [Cupriavidus pinatubonensis]
MVLVSALEDYRAILQVILPENESMERELSLRFYFWLSGDRGAAGVIVAARQGRLVMSGGMTIRSIR